MNKFSKAKQLAIFIEFLDKHNAFCKYVDEMQFSDNRPRAISWFADFDYKVWIWGAFRFKTSVCGQDYWCDLACKWEECCKQFA